MTDAEMKEILRKLDTLSQELGKNSEAVARVHELERTSAAGDVKVKAFEAAIEEIKRADEERRKAIEDLRRGARLQRAAEGGDRPAALTAFGAMMRQELCRALRIEMPAAFKHEAEIVRAHLERATLYAGGTTGSYTVPTITMAELIDTLEEVSDLLSRVELISDLPAASTINIPTLTGRPTLQATRASVDTAMSQSDPTFGQLQVTPAEAYIYFPVDNRLLQMSALPLGTMLVNVLRDAIAAGMCDWLLNGDGTSTYNSITGILKQATAAYLYTMPSGKVQFSHLAKSDLTGAMAKTLKRGRSAGVWLGNLEILGVCEDMDRTGKTAVVSYGNNGGARVLMHDFVIEEGMPALAASAANTGFLGFGDLSTFLVGLVGGVQVASSTDYLFGKNQTAFRGVLNMDIQRKPAATFMLVKTAAA
jgi:HK97 family phage major capsid protein